MIALRALLPDAPASNLPLVSSSTSTATFRQLTTAGIQDAAVTLDKIALSARAPIGAVQMFAGATAPAGWVLCRGQEVPRAAYTALFAVVGTTYGSGNGTTTFRLPNLQARFPIGVEAASGTVLTLGATGGSATQDLEHVHGLGGHTHTASHAHTVDGPSSQILVGDPTTTVNSGGTTNPKAGGQYHGHSISFSNLPTSTSSADTGEADAETDWGGDSAQPIMPPYLSLNFIIFAGV